MILENRNWTIIFFSSSWNPKDSKVIFFISKKLLIFCLPKKYAITDLEGVMTPKEGTQLKNKQKNR